MTLRIRDKDGEIEFFILSNCDTNNPGGNDICLIVLRKNIYIV